MQGREHDWDERDWDRLVEQIKDGCCTPFLGAGACSGTLPSRADLGRSWARHYQYPFGDESQLHEVMQYATTLEEDPVSVKRRVTRELSELGAPDYTDPTEPHALLARFPIKVYLTTNYDDFMTRALERERKQPVTAVCPWYRGADTDLETSLPAGYEPDSRSPLVYHLHGSFRSSASLVLAEADYVEFLVKLAKDLGEDARRVVPVQILPALTRQPLLSIGYSLRDWSFRMLFHGFVATVADVQRRRHVSVQLAPDADTSDDVRSRTRFYLTRYLAKLNLSVYWGSAREFCAELGRRLERA